MERAEFSVSAGNNHVDTEINIFKLIYLQPLDLVCRKVKAEAPEDATDKEVKGEKRGKRERTQL